MYACRAKANRHHFSTQRRTTTELATTQRHEQRGCSRDQMACLRGGRSGVIIVAATLPTANCDTLLESAHFGTADPLRGEWLLFARKVTA